MVLPERPVCLKQWPRLAIQPEQWISGQVELRPDQRHYLERVRRLQGGDRFLVFDGSGGLWQMIWQGGVAVVDRPLQPVARELGVDLHLGLALIKGGGMDEVIRQVTELGVSQIWPLLTERTVMQPGGSKQQRWQKIAMEAAEQSERLRWPQIQTPLSWWQWLSQYPRSGQGSGSSAGSGAAADHPKRALLMAVARAEAPHLLQALQHLPQQISEITIAVGPEGGWTETEIQQGQEVGAQPISLGPRVLRAATAPILAAGLVAAVWEGQHG